MHSYLFVSTLFLIHKVSLDDHSHIILLTILLHYRFINFFNNLLHPFNCISDDLFFLIRGLKPIDDKINNECYIVRLNSSPINILLKEEISDSLSLGLYFFLDSNVINYNFNDSKPLFLLQSHFRDN